MANAPVGTCYPTSQILPSFSRDITITLAIILNRISWKQFSSECDPLKNDLAFVEVKKYPPYEGGILSFKITLNFSLNPNFQQGDNPNTKYSCMNIEEYSNTFNQKNTDAIAQGIQLAYAVERDMPDTDGKCRVCSGGIWESKKTTRKQKVTCSSSVIVKQVIAPGCGP